jgi:acetylornithine deacetylase/succinyl-diaminopimelate desuccinylase-like protein
VDIARIREAAKSRYGEHLARIQGLVRQVSVSPEGRGIRECAELVAGHLSALGAKSVRLVETGGNPVVYGEYDAGRPLTVLLYGMYDTMPADEPGWTVPPFEGRVVELSPFGQCIVARGAYNTKGALMAFLNACELIRDVEGELPVNLIFAIEGEEELGSRNLPRFIEKMQQSLRRADVLFSPIPSENRVGRAVQHLGVKGIVYFEVELDGARWGRGPTEFGIHGSNKAWVDSPVWRLIHALSTMTTEDGNRVLIEGFYDDVAVPTAEDLELLEELSNVFDENVVKEEMRVKQFIGDKRGLEALKLYLFSPTLNINGIWGGYTGPGTKTLLPHKVTAKMDVRLVPNMRREKVLPLIRRHLDRMGYPEVEIRVLEEGYNPARMSYKNKYVQAVWRVYRSFGKQVERWPTLAGSAPFSMFAEPPLNLPFVEGGLGHGGLAHSPNEYLVVGEGGPTGGLVTMETSFAAILHALAEAQGQPEPAGT